MYKLFALAAGEAQTRSPTTGVKQVAGQVAFYDDGVGADGIWGGRVAEGATGAGLELKLRDCYKFISEPYEPRDRRYLFGFSRGAFTARSLGGDVDLLRGAVSNQPKRYLCQSCVRRVPPQ